MSNTYVQRLKTKIRDVIFECESLDDYLDKLAKDGKASIQIDEARKRVSVIKDIANEKV